MPKPLFPPAPPLFPALPPHPLKRSRCGSNIFKELRVALAGLEWAERDHQRRTQRKCDLPWEWRERKRDLKRRRRNSLLPKSRRCGRCGEAKLESRRWVVPEGREAVCLSCSRVGEPGEDPGTSLLDRAPDGEGFVVSGPAMRHARLILGVSAGALARQCGWSQPRWSQLEGRAQSRVTRRVGKLILRALVDISGLQTRGL